MKKILNNFKNTLEENPDCPVSFSLNADDPQSMRFIEYLNDNKNLIEHNGKITFIPFGKNVERFICGVAPMWKKYEDIRLFEYYYTNSEMMRELFCNEKDDNDKLMPLYADIGGVKYIVTWESKGDTDSFHYKAANSEERGLLDMLWSIFGGITTKNDEDKDETKKLNPQIGVSFDVALSKDYGYNLGVTKMIYEHAHSLGYAVGGNISLSIGQELK